MFFIPFKTKALKIRLLRELYDNLIPVSAIFVLVKRQVSAVFNSPCKNAEKERRNGLSHIFPQKYPNFLGIIENFI